MTRDRPEMRCACGKPATEITLGSGPQCAKCKAGRRTSKASRVARGDRVRVIGGAWEGSIGKIATVEHVYPPADNGEQVIRIVVDGEPGTLSLAASDVEPCSEGPRISGADDHPVANAGLPDVSPTDGTSEAKHSPVSGPEEAGTTSTAPNAGTGGGT